MRDLGHHKIAVPVLGLGLISISFASVLIKLCQAPSASIAAYRLVIAAAFYLLYVFIRNHNFKELRKVFQQRIALLSGLFLAIHFATWIASLKYTSVASSVLLVTSSPVFVALGSYLFLKEKLSSLTIIGIVIAFAGAVAISSSDLSMNRSSLFGNMLALAGAVAAAGYLLSGRKLRKHMNTLDYVTAVYTIAALVLLGFALVQRAPMIGFSTQTLLLFFAIAMVPQVIGHTTLNWALKYFSATAVAVVTLGEPIGASLLAFIILGENLSAVKILTGVVILAGVSLVLFAEMRQQEKSRRTIDLLT